MIEVTGKNGTAKIFCDQRDELGIAHLYRVMSAGVTKGSVVRVMPDYHEGKGSVIGFTQKLNPHDLRVCPNTVGVDIGCRVSSVMLPSVQNVDFEELDKFIRANIPLGAGSYKKDGLDKRQLSMIYEKDLEKLEAAERLIFEDGSKTPMKVSSLNQLFSLGGGNHFISLNQDKDGNIWLSVHSGSRNFGLTVATIYQKIAEEICDDDCEKEMKYLDNSSPYLDHYFTCVDACQAFSEINHRLLIDFVARHLYDVQKLPFKLGEGITTLHNYIDLRNMIIRKGAVSAKKGEKLLIPFNMRDGIGVCIGKGNEDFTFSAPHGAGRLLSRSEAKQILDLEEEKKGMIEAGVFTTSLDYALDEAASAYKDKTMILEMIEPTAEVIDVMREIYNIKGR